MNALKKMFWWFAFILASIFFLHILYMTIGFSIMGVAYFKLNIFLLIFGFIIMAALSRKIFSKFLAWNRSIIISLCPNQNKGYRVFGILSVISFIPAIIGIWTIEAIKTGPVITSCIIGTLLYSEFCYHSLFLTSITLNNSDISNE